MNVSLPGAMKKWVENQVGDGLYSNACDYVRDLIIRIRMLKKYELLIVAESIDISRLEQDLSVLY